MRNLKLQSAMEYLMTYGWAILIIAVVLGVLFQLGVFSSSSFSVRAPPGACRVLRTSVAVNLVGQCSGQLPQYVAQFNGQTSTINIGSAAALNPTSSQTASVWFKLGAVAPPSQWPGEFGNGKWAMYEETLTSAIGSYVTTDPGAVTTWCSISPSGSVPLDTWHHYVQTYDGSNIITYFDGQKIFTCPKTGTMVAGPLYISSTTFKGSITNAQLYNVSLAANDIQALYLEGMGGAPVMPSNLIGWWPLNGDTKDYSSGNNNGVPTAVSYASQYGK
jgi:hypothetical protein